MTAPAIDAPAFTVATDGEPTDSAIAALARLLLAVADDDDNDNEATEAA